MLVSIVLPTYNGSKYIRSAINSCLQQTYQEIELIIVDDCSTDNTSSIIAGYAQRDKRITVITNSCNKQLPGSLNIGFEIAKGHYYTWISDDNIFADQAIETMVTALQKGSDHDIVYSSYSFIDENGNKLDTFCSIPEELIFKCSPGACFLYTSKVHKELCGYDQSKFRMEDMDFWLRAAVKFKFKFIDYKDLYYYRKHNDNLTSAIFSNSRLYEEYRSNHLLSFQQFFKNGLGFDISKDDLKLHLELYFEDISINKDWDFSISEKVVDYLSHLDKLSGLSWKLIGFDEIKVRNILKEKREKVVKLVINDLFFENQLLQSKRPRLASQFNKPISWYYKEYEVLPGWFKKIGHVLKVLQGNRPWKSLMRNQDT